MVTPYAQGAVFEAAASVDFCPIGSLLNGRSLLVLTPHPDDESLGCGGALAAASEIGTDIFVACLTDGAGSHPNSQIFSRDRLVALRKRELQSAVTTLTGGKGQVSFLGLPDQGVTPHAISKAALFEKLEALIIEHHIGMIWTTWRLDPHIDHQAASHIASELCLRNPRLRMWEFPIWGRFTRDQIEPGTDLQKFDASPYQTLKRDAVGAHQSQMSGLIDDDPLGFILDPIAREHFINFPEIFIGRVSRGQ